MNSEAVPAAVALTAEAEKLTLVDHPIAQHALTALRNRHTNSADFRVHCHQLLLLLVMEATRRIPLRDEKVETSSQAQVGKVMDRITVLLSISRDGLGLAHHLADFVPRVSIGSISIGPGSDHHRPEARLHLSSSPCFADARVIIFEPIVATGLSATLALNLLRRAGAIDVAVVSFLLSAPGLAQIQAAHPEVSIWGAGVDTEWDAKRGSLPGISDFSARLYP